MTDIITGRAHFQDGPSNSGPAVPPMDGAETLVATYPPGGVYRIEQDGSGVRVWRSNAVARAGDGGTEQARLEAVNARNRAHYGQAPAGGRR